MSSASGSTSDREGRATAGASDDFLSGTVRNALQRGQQTSPVAHQTSPAVQQTSPAPHQILPVAQQTSPEADLMVAPLSRAAEQYTPFFKTMAELNCQRAILIANGEPAATDIPPITPLEMTRFEQMRSSVYGTLATVLVLNWSTISVLVGLGVVTIVGSALLAVSLPNHGSHDTGQTEPRPRNNPKQTPISRDV